MNMVLLFGLLGMAGVSPIAGMVTEIGGRLQSFFGYAAAGVAVSAFLLPKRALQSAVYPQFLFTGGA